MANCCKNGGIMVQMMWVMWVLLLITATSGWSAGAPDQGVGEASRCSDEQAALNSVSACVEEGTVARDPSASCCEGMKDLAETTSLDCLCDVLISAAGGGQGLAQLVHAYLARCAIPRIPPHFRCTL